MAESTQPTVDTKKLTTKLSAMQELLRTHYSVYVHIDSRREGVIVPKHLVRHDLCLQLGLNMRPTPVADLKLDKKGFNATLTFNRQPLTVFVPWPSVFAIVGDSGIGVQYVGDIPAEVAKEGRLKKVKTFSGDKPVAVQRDPDKHKTLPAGWRVIDGGKTEG